MALEWSSNLSTGVDWQDRHHKELFKRVNGLLDAMSTGMGQGELDRMFKFLDSYFIVHFDAEEQAMSKYGFPGTVEHLCEHTGFIEDVARLKRECENGVSAGLVVKAQKLVIEWLLNHIGGSDKKLGAHILMTETERHVRD